MKPHSEEFKRRLSEIMKGNKNACGPKSKEHRRKISESHKRIGSPWLVGKKRKPFSETHRKNMSLQRIGKILTEEQKENIFTPEFLKRKSEAQKGEKGSNWKGGVTKAHKALRNTFEYRNWRKKVLKRDNYTCQDCYMTGIQLHADHIKPFILYPESRFDVENGRTLCFPCHKKTPTYGGKMNNFKP